MLKKICKKYCVLLSILMILLMFNGCSTNKENSKNTNSNNIVKKITGDKIGKYQRNISIQLVKNDNSIYMINHKDIHLHEKAKVTLRKFNDVQDINSAEKMTEISNNNIADDSSLDNLNYYNGYLYFTWKDADKNPYVCRMKPDGTDFKKIIDITKTCTSAQRLVIYNDYMYYLDENPKVHSTILCKVSLDGTYHKVIFDDIDISTVQDVQKIDSFYIYKNNIYIESDGNIYKGPVDGSGFKKISDEGVNNLLVFKDKIYFIKDGENDQPIYVMDLDGSNKKALNRNASVLNVSNNNLYYISKKLLYKMDLDGSNDKKMSDASVDWCSILDESTIICGEDYSTKSIIITDK